MNCKNSYAVCNEIKGEDCPTANPKCEDEWNTTCVTVNNMTMENYEGLDYAELVNQTAKAMTPSANSTIYMRDAEDYIANWTQGSAIQELWDKYPAKQ